ncbi:unnamed protein product [Heligmosomoides polygyrus]|uniref:DC_STAMP domain-containing protein n=1 Tax=Heligmosomoides polygyrus TaxID=6339 RepID=A0A183GGX5_HELPZ|nr:unnamed protein product [Heligmosomoides polygyrus]
MTSYERAFYRLRVVMTLILSSTPFCFLCMDELVYSILSTAFAYMSLVRIDYPSHFEVKVSSSTISRFFVRTAHALNGMEHSRVSGDGESAKMMRSIQDVFSPLTSDIRERDDRWRNCFTEPTPPNYDTRWTIVLMFVAAMFLCRFQKELADDQLAGREGIVRRGMQSRGFIRVNCSICNAPDLRVADQSNTRLCASCGVFYCIQCFSMRRYCKDCHHDMQTVDRVELYYEELTDDEESEEDEEDEVDGTSLVSVSSV